MLDKPPSITSRAKTKYAKKWVDDQFGGHETEEAVGTEDGFDICLLFSPNAPAAAFDAALRLSPPAGIMRHVQRLTLHKMLGSKKEDRAVLLNDYVERLKNHSEFAVYLACRHFWENDPSDFAPKLGKLAALVEEIENEIRWRKRQIEGRDKMIEAQKKPPEPKTYREKTHEEFTPEDWQAYVDDAKGMLELAKQNPQFIDPAGWETELKRREEIRAEKQAKVAV